MSILFFLKLHWFYWRFVCKPVVYRDGVLQKCLHISYDIFVISPTPNLDACHIVQKFFTIDLMLNYLTDPIT